MSTSLAAFLRNSGELPHCSSAGSVVKNISFEKYLIENILFEKYFI